MTDTPSTDLPASDAPEPAPAAVVDPPARADPAAPAGIRYTVERRVPAIAVLAVEVDADRLERASERAFRRHVGQARIPGFRPGKAPRAIYERTYGANHLWEDAAGDLVDESFKEIVDREGLVALDRPDVEVSQLEPGKDLRYTATFPVRPEVALGDYAAHGATVAVEPLQEEEVEKTIAGMREHHAELRPVDRPAAATDVLTIDLDVVIDRKQLPPMGRNAHLELGREYPIPGLAEGLVGATAGETRTLDLAFPEDYPDEDLRGKQGSFSAKVTAVAEKLLPDLDDSFAKTVGVENLAALDRAVRGELAHSAFHEARDAAAAKLLAHLLSTATVEVPEILVQDELDHLTDDLKGRIAEQGISWEQFLLQARKTEAEIRTDWREAAERRAKSLLVLDALAKREDVQITGAELAQEVALTPLAQQDPAALRDPAVLSSLARSMRNRKVVDKLIGLAGPDAERELMKAAGAPDDIADPHGLDPHAAEPPEGGAPAAADAGPLIVPERSGQPAATTGGRDAIRAMLEDKDPVD